MTASDPNESSPPEISAIESTESTTSITPLTSTDFAAYTNFPTAVAIAQPRIFRVLIVVDALNDFCPKGNLPVTGGDEIIPVINRLLQEGAYDCRVAGNDEHDPKSGSFASQHPGTAVFQLGVLSGMPQMLWPDHGVKGTWGAKFHPGINVSLVDKIFVKGTKIEVDSYSALYDNGKAASDELKLKYPFLGQSTGLAEYIIAEATAAGADEIEVDVCGLALDYCVKFTAKDSAQESFRGTPFRVRVVLDATRAIGDVPAAVSELALAGVSTVDSAQVLTRAQSTV